MTYSRFELVRPQSLLPESARLWLRRQRDGRFNLRRQDDWSQRAHDAVRLWTQLRADSTGEHARLQVADFGAGNERLRSILQAELAAPHDYRPFDLNPQRETTRRLNVLDGLPAQRFDLAFCLGLLEYVPLDNPLLARLRETCGSVVVSYVVTDSPLQMTRRQREAAGWVSHLSSAQVEAEFEARGFVSAGHCRTDNDRTALWLWDRGPGSGCTAGDDEGVR